MAGGEIRLEGLTKRFGGFTAVDGIDLEMPAAGFFSLLGPSGCGKTTTLRMIAGFEEPTGGRILLDGDDIASTPPNKRNINTVFQSYALFPHLTVSDNVAFGLKRQRADRAEIKRRVAETLELVQLTGFERRKPGQLSGGQQQRVALARALVLKPAVLLLDEPLGALDAKLRRRLQLELKSLQQQVGITFVYVTHDQEEALTMSDHVAVMNQGRVEQVAPPRDVYEEPATAFVADFLGVSNLMDARIEGRDAAAAVISIDGQRLLADAGDVDASGDVRVVIRPERVQLEPQGSAGENRIPGMVERQVYLGNAVHLHVRLAGGQSLTALVQNTGAPLQLDAGTPVVAYLPAAALRVLAGGHAVAPPTDDEAAAIGSPAG